jgi:hypothetical protein
MASFGCKRITNSFGAAPSQIKNIDMIKKYTRKKRHAEMRYEKEQTWEEMISWTFELDTNFGFSLVLKNKQAIVNKKRDNMKCRRDW